MNTVQNIPFATADLSSEDRQLAYMRSLGAKNLDPPLLPSSHLKLIKSGHVVPYDPILAIQTSLVVNCDAYGNTDPMAWLPTVRNVEEDPVEARARIVAAQAEVMAQALSITATHKQPHVDYSPRPMELPHGAVMSTEVAPAPVQPSVTAPVPAVVAPAAMAGETMRAVQEGMNRIMDNIMGSLGVA